MTGKHTKALFFILYSLALLSLPAAGLELSLEENKGESGTVGYVDIDRVFKEYSGTLNAREEFLGEIKKKEESVNLRKHAVYALKADIAKLKQEREFALTLPSLLATAEQLNRREPQIPIAPSTAAASSGPPAGLPMEVAPSTGTEKPAALPVSSAPVISSAAVANPQQPAAAVQVPAQIPPGGLPGIDMPGIAAVPVSYFKFTISTSVPEIDAAIAAKETDLKQKEEALRLYQRQVERELLEYESHRSEILLGRIYIALKELAVREGVSVIVDKRNILFGHSAVDLTGKLLTALEEGQ